MRHVGKSYPDWLPNQIFNDTFDWTKSIKTNFITFLHYVTLHDSNCIALNLNNYGEVILAIELDAYWNKEFSHIHVNNLNWPFLIIRIPKTINVSFNYAEVEMILSKVETRFIPKSEIEKFIGILSNTNLLPQEFYKRLVDCKELHKTKFIDLGGANVEILHYSEIEVLLFEQEGNYIDTSLEGIKPFVEAISSKVERKGIIKGIWDKLAGK